MPYFIPSKNMYDNYHGVSRLHDDIDRLFGGAMFPSCWSPAQEAEPVAPSADFRPQLDVLSNEASYIMRIELAGVGPEDINIKVADNVLTVSGEKKQEDTTDCETHVQERNFGTFSRALTLPDDADMGKICAFSKDGILSVEIPRKKPEEAKIRTIEVQKG